MKKILNLEFKERFILSALFIFFTVNIIKNGTYSGFIGLALMFWLYYRYKVITKFRKISKPVLRSFKRHILLFILFAFITSITANCEIDYIKAIDFLIIKMAIALFLFEIFIKDIPNIIGEVIAIKKMNKIQYAAVDVDGAEEYFRDILKIASPLIIGYTDNLTVDKNTILSELLYLKDKGAIEIENGRIVKTSEEIAKNLLPCEQLLLRMLFYETISMHELNLETIKASVEEDAASIFSLTKTIDNIASEKNKRIILVILAKLLLVASIIFIYFVIRSTDEIMAGIFVMDAMILLGANHFKKTLENAQLEYYGVLATTSYFFFYVADSITRLGLLIVIAAKIIFSYQKKRYDSGAMQIRTKEGEALNQKIEGLKIFLNDYSLLDKKNSKDIALWKEYLIYSVMFGQNTNIAEEFKDCIKF